MGHVTGTHRNFRAAAHRSVVISDSSDALRPTVRGNVNIRDRAGANSGWRELVRGEVHVTSEERWGGESRARTSTATGGGPLDVGPLGGPGGPAGTVIHSNDLVGSNPRGSVTMRSAALVADSPPIQFGGTIGSPSTPAAGLGAIPGAALGAGLPGAQAGAGAGLAAGAGAGLGAGAGAAATAAGGGAAAAGAGATRKKRGGGAGGAGDGRGAARDGGRRAARTDETKRSGAGARGGAASQATTRAGAQGTAANRQGAVAPTRTSRTNRQVNNRTAHAAGTRSGRSGSSTRKTHKVRAGESLAEIAKRYDVGVERLRDANKLKRGEKPEVGSQLVIPQRARS